MLKHYGRLLILTCLKQYFTELSQLVNHVACVISCVSQQVVIVRKSEGLRFYSND